MLEIIKRHVHVVLLLYNFISHFDDITNAYINDILLPLSNRMTSQHGKWTLSDSDDDGDNVVPPTPPKDTKKLLKSIKPDLEPKASQVNTQPKSEPRTENKVKLQIEKNSIPPLGSEALKRKRETDEGGWNLSSSDDDDDDGAPSSAPKNKPQPKAQNSSPPRKKAEWSRPPSPHGDNYYKEEPSDFFEASLNTMNDMYRFYLNKVTGIEKKYNTGALHIKGEHMIIRSLVFYVRSSKHSLICLSSSR